MLPTLLVTSALLIVQIVNVSSQVSGSNSTSLFHHAICSDEEYLSMPVLFHLDDYDRCMMLSDDALFCQITFQLYPENPENPSEIWKIIEKVSANPNNYRHDQLRHGICVSETCPNATKSTDIKEGLSQCYSQKYKQMGIKAEVAKIRCESRESSYPIDNLDIAFMIFIIFYIGFVIFASLYEGLARYKTEKEYEKITGTTFGSFVSAFSIPRNWMRLKTVNLDNPDIRQLRFIQGIRFYNLLLVILAHACFVILSMPLSNTTYGENITQDFFFVYLGNGGFATMTNFMITTWLFTYHFFTEFDGKRDVKIRDFFMVTINRYIRLTPLYAIMIGFQATWFVHLGRGPFWDEYVGKEFRRCRENWWTNLLYIHTSVNKERMCLPQTWYLGIDMQLFILTFFLLWFAVKRQKRFSLIIGGLIIAHITIMFNILYWNDWGFNYKYTIEQLYSTRCLDDHEWHMVLSSVYGNLPGVTAGLTFGYIYYKTKNKTLFTSKLQIFVWWCVCWGLALGSITISGLHLRSSTEFYNGLFDCIFGSLCKTAFVFGIGIAMIGFAKGVGSVMNWVLEWSPTYVLGRLSYSAFLANSLFPRVRAGRMRSLRFLSYDAIVGEFFQDIACTLICALFLTLLFEMPVSELQKRLIVKPKKKTK